jgi:hypothetical protein
MIDLALLVIASRVVGLGLGPIIGTRTVAADGDVLRDHLCSPANQWRLASSFADVVLLRPAGERGDARLPLALGERCQASLHVKADLAAGVLRSAVRIGRRSVARVTWILTPGRGTTGPDVCRPASVAQPRCPPCAGARRRALDRAAPRHRACDDVCACRRGWRRGAHRGRHLLVARSDRLCVGRPAGRRSRVERGP